MGRGLWSSPFYIMNKDLEYIVKLERAIKQKYGSDAIQNPASYWDEEKRKRISTTTQRILCKKRI